MSEKEYVCYSPNLYLYLLASKFVPIRTGIHKITKKTYAVFAVDSELSTALDGWTNIKSHTGVINNHEPNEKERSRC